MDLPELPRNDLKGRGDLMDLPELPVHHTPMFS